MTFYINVTLYIIIGIIISSIVYRFFFNEESQSDPGMAFLIVLFLVLWPVVLMVGGVVLASTAAYWTVRTLGSVGLSKHSPQRPGTVITSNDWKDD